MAGSDSKNNEVTTMAGLSRRRFLKYALGGAAGAAVLAVHGNAILGGSKEPDTPDVSALNDVEKSSFSDRKGEAFTITKGAFDVVELELAEVSDVICNNIGERDKVFSLLFKGPHSSPLEQGTYVMTNKAMGSFPLFIVPVCPGKHSMYYEAIFNRFQV
jgi:hypothetical protein